MNKLLKLHSLSKERLFVAIFLYFFLVLLIRLIFTNSLEIDEAEQALLSQQLQLGYNQQPPLYTWITVFLIKLFGLNVFPFLIFRTFLLTITYYLIYCIALEINNNRNYAIISSLSLFLFFQLSIESFRQTHTVLVTVAVLLLALIFFQLKNSKSLTNYVFLGLIMSFGMYSKYNFAIPLLAMTVGSLLVKDFKNIVWNPKIVISIVILLLLFSPQFFWLLENAKNTTSETVADLGPNAKKNYLATIPISIWALLKGVLSYIIGFLVLILIFFRRHITSFFKLKADKNTLFIKNFLIISLLFLGFILIISKASNVRERWLQPILIMLPIAFFGHFAFSDYTNKAFKRYKKTVFIIALLIPMYIMASIVLGPSIGFKERINRPYIEFANYLKKEKKELLLTSDVIISEGYDLSGNLRLGLKNHTVNIFNNDCDLRFGDVSINDMKKIIFITINENNNNLKRCLLNSTSRTYNIKNFQKAFFYNYSNTHKYAFYISVIEFD